MDDINAADLPEGSIVASQRTAWIRVLPGPGTVWHGTDSQRRDDRWIDHALVETATVLRHGYGEG